MAFVVFFLALFARALSSELCLEAGAGVIGVARTEEAAVCLVFLGQLPSEKVVVGFRGINAFLEGIWSPRVCVVLAYRSSLSFNIKLYKRRTMTLSSTVTLSRSRSR